MGRAIFEFMMILLLIGTFASLLDVQLGKSCGNTGIMTDGTLFPYFMEVVILEVNASLYRAHAGDIVHVYVTVEATWDVFDFSSFWAEALSNNGLIDREIIFVLLSGHEIFTFDFAWNTSGVGFGSYVISATTSTMSYFVDGCVRILPAGATTMVPDDYPTIQEAINAAGSGDTVFVRNGVYYEDVVVNKSISIVGESRDGTLVRGVEGGYGSVFQVTENEVTIRGFSLGSAVYGVYLSGSNGSRVSDNLVDDVEVGGVVLESSCNNTVEANIFGGFPSIGIGVVWDSEQNTIRLNEVKGSHDYGINVIANNNLIVDNTILNNTAALYIAGANNTIYHNNIVGNDFQVIGGELALWDNGCEGNYWSNYNGTDLNGDGIGDTYLLWEGVDNFPLMNFYWNRGDIDHDLDVDIFDVVKCAVAYGSTPLSPNWNPHCDIAEPYDAIDIFDIVTIAGTYGRKYTP